MMPLYLSTAYLPPVQYFCKLYALQGEKVYLEACESFVKQTYRNRCHILGAHGVEALSLPIEHSPASRVIRDIRLSGHDRWQHRHIGAIETAYGASPYFEYYWDDIRPLIETASPWLWELNYQLTERIASLLPLELALCPTEQFLPPSGLSTDLRYSIRPKQAPEDETFAPQPYYQPHPGQGFVPNLSILDLLFNMGPESLLVLRASIR